MVVHSALAGISNRLEAALKHAAAGTGGDDAAAIAAAHHALAAELQVDGPTLIATELAGAGTAVVRHPAGARSQPARARAGHGLGELMASRLGAAYLASQQLPVTLVDAREVLVARDEGHDNERARYLAASCEFDPDPALAAEFAGVGGVILTQGFIARTAQGDDVLLGRGGSDTTAAYLAAKLQAEGLEIWTDVPGMFSADPRVVPGARLLKQLSYEEAQEIASTGGSVLHPRSIRPVRRQGVPLRVLCTHTPDRDGTLISCCPGQRCAARNGTVQPGRDHGGVHGNRGHVARGGLSDGGLSLLQ